MKDSMQKLWLVVSTFLFFGLIIPTLNANSFIPAHQKEVGKVVFGGAYLQFASKMGGTISKKELSGHAELGVEGCAKGSRIFQFTLQITHNGKTTIFQSRSNRLTQEMIAALSKLSVGDEFEFQKVKAYLPNSKDEVDVFGKKFIVIT